MHSIKTILCNFANWNENVNTKSGQNGHLVICHFRFGKHFFAHHNIKYILYYGDDFDRIRFRFWQMTKWPKWPHCYQFHKLQLTDNQVDETKKAASVESETGQNLLIRRAISLDFIPQKPSFPLNFYQKSLYSLRFYQKTRVFSLSFHESHNISKSSLLLIELMITSHRIPHSFSSNSSLFRASIIMKYLGRVTERGVNFFQNGNSIPAWSCVYFLQKP